MQTQPPLYVTFDPKRHILLGRGAGSNLNDANLVFRGLVKKLSSNDGIINYRKNNPLDISKDINDFLEREGYLFVKREYIEQSGYKYEAINWDDKKSYNNIPRGIIKKKISQLLTDAKPEAKNAKLKHFIPNERLESDIDQLLQSFYKYFQQQKDKGYPDTLHTANNPARVKSPTPANYTYNTGSYIFIAPKPSGHQIQPAFEATAAAGGHDGSNLAGHEVRGNIREPGAKTSSLQNLVDDVVKSHLQRLCKDGNGPNR